MKVAIMQPYFFPYLGYFQLINAVDKFVFYNDVQYIKGGWINRNKILLEGKCFDIVIPIEKGSFKWKINERKLVENSLRFKHKLLLQIGHAYKRAPYFNELYPFIERLILFEESNIDKFNIRILKELCCLLQISSKLFISSELDLVVKLEGVNRVISINQFLGSQVYINPIGGMNLYPKDLFVNKGIDIKFLKTDGYSYRQFNSCFIPDLSIIDLLMFNSIESARELLNKYHLE